MTDPTPTPPKPTLPDLTRQQVIDRILTALLTALAAVVVPWLLPFTRPPAPDLLPSAPAAIQAAQGAKAAAVLEDVGLLE